MDIPKLVLVLVGERGFDLSKTLVTLETWFPPNLDLTPTAPLLPPICSCGNGSEPQWHNKLETSPTHNI